MDQQQTGTGPAGGGVTGPTLSEGWLANWRSRLYRSEKGTPLIPAEFAAGQGSIVRLIDIREPQELIGPFGYIPGVDWIPREEVHTLPKRLGPNAPVILVSRLGERASEVARQLEQGGMKYVAALAGGMGQWLSLGFSTIQDPSILDRCDELREIEAPIVPESKESGLTIDQVRDHVGDPASVRWLKLAALVMHAPMSCIDGRDDRGVVGTPGGDAGLFILLLAAIEKVIGKPLTHEQISTLLKRRIDSFGSFYMHTDATALTAAAVSMKEDPRLGVALEKFCSGPDELRQFVRRPPASYREAVVEHLCNPAAIGCGHIRLMHQNSEQYRVRQGLVVDFLRSFYQARWEGAFRAEYEALHGSHDERAVLITRVEGELFPFTPIPLISPSYFDMQMFIYHPQASKYLRSLIIDMLLLQTDVVPEFKPELRAQLIQEAESLADLHRGASLVYLAKNLPIYEVTFKTDGTIQVGHAGNVT
ncbi:rhodanese-like domain-containing protein [Singulisphaera sp. PoT]|uniref:rhodanese-like domain-containing protein n=1 Tax=Singulisphaera sp. PoT TaxID=3411797 RepID=UPI003BF49E51